MINGLGNEWGDILVLPRPFVDGAVVLDWVEFSIFLLHKEVGSVGAPRFPYSASFQVFGHEFSHLFLLLLIQGEESCRESSGCVGEEFNCVVPNSMLGKVLRLFLAKYFLVSLVLPRKRGCSHRLRRVLAVRILW